MSSVTPTDRIRSRTVANNANMIQEHLEAMQRDSHGLEYAPWKGEVDAMWKKTFAEISLMGAGPQQASLESIRELWTTYITHYATV